MATQVFYLYLLVNHSSYANYVVLSFGRIKLCEMLYIQIFADSVNKNSTLIVKATN